VDCTHTSEHHERELSVQLSVNDFLRGAHDQLHLFVGQLSQLFIRKRRAFLEDAQRPDYRMAPAIALDANWKIMAGPLRLSAPQMLARDFNIAEGVLFYTLRPVDCIAGFHVALRYWATLVVMNGLRFIVRRLWHAPNPSSAPTMACWTAG